MYQLNQGSSRRKAAVAIIAAVAVSIGGISAASAKNGADDRVRSTSTSTSTTVAGTPSGGGGNPEIRAMRDTQKAALKAKKDALKQLKKSDASDEAIDKAKDELKALKDSQRAALKAKVAEVRPQTGSDSSDDDGTADQGRGDRSDDSSKSSSDDDGTPDQGKGDR